MSNEEFIAEFRDWRSQWKPSLTETEDEASYISRRIAATWYSYSSFDFDLNFTDGKSHHFALYALDWDSARSETIQIVDANTAVVLDTRNISGFTNGIYLIWNISGHVKINVTCWRGQCSGQRGVFQIEDNAFRNGAARTW